MRKISTLQFIVNTIHPVKKDVLFTGSPKSEAFFRAPDDCVANIMNFARSYRVTETKGAGKVEMILN